MRESGIPGRHKVMGLQFHLETTPESALALLENCREDLTPGPYVQSEAEFHSAPGTYYRASNALMNEVLSYLLRESRQPELAGPEKARC